MRTRALFLFGLGVCGCSGDPGTGQAALSVRLEGEATITQDGSEIARARPGDTIGEIAALEWAAGFGYARTATAIAATPMRVLVFACGDVVELAREIPMLGERLRGIARSRLHQS